MEVKKNLSNLLSPPSLMATLVLLLLVGQVDMAAATSQPLWVGNLTQDVYGPPADFVWPYFADFCNVARISTQAISFCERGVSGQIGQERYVLAVQATPSNVNETYVRWEKHRLTALDHAKRTLTYSIVGNNLVGLNTFISTFTILPKDYGCQIKWDYVVNPLPGLQLGQVHGLTRSNLERMATKIEDLLINIE